MKRWTLSPTPFVWASVAAIIHMLGGFGADNDTLQILLGSAGLAHSIAGFWTDGKERLTAPSIYFFAAGLFIYFPGIYLVSYDPISFGQATMVPALTICYVSQLIMYYVFWQPRESTIVRVAGSTSPKVTTWGIWTGLTLIAVGAALSVVGYGQDPLVSGAAFSGVALLAVASLRREKRVSIFTYGVVGAGFLAYMEFVFTGFGRLELGSMALCIAMAAAHRWKGRMVKAAMLVGIVPGLMYLAESRAEFTASLNPAQSASVNGLESVVSPLVRFAQLIDMQAAGEITQAWFEPLFATLVLLVPRQIWPDKPIGFGAQLGHMFRPDLDGTGHSELALFHGEWLVSFGIAGLVVMVPVFALIVRWLDRVMVSAQSIALTDRMDLLKIVAITIAGASIVDLLWGGSFTYMARVGTRLLVLLVVFALFAWRREQVKQLKASIPSSAYRHMQRRKAERAGEGQGHSDASVVYPMSPKPAGTKDMGST